MDFAEPVERSSDQLVLAARLSRCEGLVEGLMGLFQLSGVQLLGADREQREDLLRAVPRLPVELVEPISRP